MHCNRQFNCCWNAYRSLASRRAKARLRASSRCAVSLLAVFIGVMLWALPTKAAWQTGQITVGNGNGGTTSYSVQKQIFQVPGYTNVMPFGLAQMDNGQIILAASLETATTITPVFSYSNDLGNTWSTFQAVPTITNRPTMLTYLGGGNLSLYGTAYFSTDYGHTWSVEGTPNEHYTSNEGNAAVIRNGSGVAVKIMETGFNFDAPNTWPTGGFGGFQTSFRYSLTGGHTWQGETFPSAWHYQDTYNGQTYTLGTGEGALVRAANGWLVAALRTDPPARFVANHTANDNLCGTAISISKDNGVTWSPLNRLFDAGRHHADLRLLPNGNLLMTMIVRDDMQFGGGLASNLRGEEALISTDNGLTWNLDNPIMLDSFNYNDPNAPFSPALCGHIATTVLTDGTVLTAYGNYLGASAVMTKWNPDALTEFAPLAGDVNQDGHVTAADIQSLMNALTDKQAYEAAHNNMSDNDFIKLADLNHDGTVSNADLQSLLVLLKSGGGSLEPVPEPASLVLLAAGGVALLLSCARKPGC